MKKYLFPTIIAIWLLVLTIFIVIFTVEKSGKKYTRGVYIHRLESKFNASREELAIIVEDYIKLYAPTSILSPLNLIDLSSKYNIDLTFILAQGHIESHFGTKGTAARTNSVFNVGAFDGHSARKQIKNGYGYKHPDYSVEPYLRLLRHNYLYPSKTEFDLMENFVDSEGQRYASNPEYEKLLQEKYIQVDKYIGKVYHKYKMYKLQLGH